MLPDAKPQRFTKSLIVYFALAYGLSWSVAIPLALSGLGPITPVLPRWAHYLTAYGPAISALVTARAIEGHHSLIDLLRRTVTWKVPIRWWLVAFSPLAVGLATIGALNFAFGAELALSDFGRLQFLPPMGAGALVLWLLTFGLGEEIGWRGFALPRLQSGRNALTATLHLAAFWAIWHLPAFFYLFEPAIAPGWLLGLFAGAVVFTWLFNSTGGSVLIAAVWHGCFNFVSSSDAADGLVSMVVSAIVMVWAVLVIIRFKPSTLSARAKVTPQHPFRQAR